MQRVGLILFPPEATIYSLISVAKVISEDINSINLFLISLVPFLLALSVHWMYFSLKNRKEYFIANIYLFSYSARP
ncbi:MAG: hypothetical protein Ct9H90mP4_10320 [Gammaproteobacteria bacterium]|nr:MAG: hypothetical protein Ct9H90mP4_10320 [Gammaproteobacteria bacterium]